VKREASPRPVKKVEKFFKNVRIENMKQKPLIFNLIALLCIIEPLIKILYFKASTQFDFMLILSNLLSRHSMREVFDFWMVYPLAGLSLIKLRKWTYFGFMSLLLYIVYSILTYEKYTWPYNSDSPFLYNYVVVALSMIVFAIFLMPNIREPFFEKRVRWWERKARYAVGIECSLKNDSIIFSSQIIDISMSGAFLKDSSYFNVGDSLNLEFTYNGEAISLPVIVMNKHSFQDKTGYGVQFSFNSFKQNVLLNKVINVIKKTHKAI
jgi:hypothetical protein